MIVVRHDDGPEIGMTGARFGGARARRKRAARPEPEPRTTAIETVTIDAGQPGAAPAASMAASTVAQPDPPRVAGEPGGSPDGAVAPAMKVRPYVLTGGRMRTRFELAVETLVSAIPRPVPGPELAEQRAVLALCRRPRAIAEIAALLRLPLGVARVLIGDLAAVGAVAVHQPRPAGDRALMERVLVGLRRL